MIKKKYLCVAVALALSSIYAQAEEINSTIEQNTPYVKDDVTVTWKGSLTASSITVTTQNLGFRSCRRRRKTVDLLVVQANPGHSRG